MSQDDVIKELRSFLGNGLSDHENRLSELEASLYYPDGLTPQVRLNKLEKIINEIANSKVPPWSAKQWEFVLQMQAKILYLEKRLNEHLDAKKRIPKQSPKGTVPL